MSPTILTIGHSNHELDHFLRLLRVNQVTAVADIRTVPYSGYCPQFDRESLQSSLKAADITYVYLGNELGARPQDSACYKDGKVNYKLMARTPLFRKGLERVVAGAEEYSIALLCSEKDPLLCHRSVLITRELEALGANVAHILEDGRIESQGDAMSRLLEQFKLGGEDLFRSREQLIEEACARQEKQVAWDNNRS